jgi:putative transposase
MHLLHLRPFENDTIVFITTCTHNRQPLLACPEAHEALREIWTKSAQLNGWFVGNYVLMPDHVHLFACPQADAVSLARRMQLWKVIAAKQINQKWSQKGTLCQPDYFDRYMRSLNDYKQKWDYVAQNPIRKKLVTQAGQWPFQGCIHDLQRSIPRGW